MTSPRRKPRGASGAEGGMRWSGSCQPTVAQLPAAHAALAPARRARVVEQDGEVVVELRRAEPEAVGLRGVEDPAHAEVWEERAGELLDVGRLAGRDEGRDLGAEGLRR